MTYICEVPLQEAREDLERLANTLGEPGNPEELATIIRSLQDNHKAATFLLKQMLHQYARTIR